MCLLMGCADRVKGNWKGVERMEKQNGLWETLKRMVGPGGLRGWSSIDDENDGKQTYYV